MNINMTGFRCFFLDLCGLVLKVAYGSEGLIKRSSCYWAKCPNFKEERMKIEHADIIHFANYYD